MGIGMSECLHTSRLIDIYTKLRQVTLDSVFSINISIGAAAMLQEANICLKILKYASIMKFLEQIFVYLNLFS